MATNTENLNLKKPAQEDFYNVEDFNENFQKIDDFAGRKDNPHGVTKEQIGLGSVQNVATNDQTPTYTESSSLTNLTSGEKLSIAFGKIKKAITNLISHLSDTTTHITSTERMTWNNGVKIQTGSYKGTGTYGANNPNILTFDFTPKLVIVTGKNTMNWGGTNYSQRPEMFFMYVWGHSAPSMPSLYSTEKSISISTSGNTLSWWVGTDAIDEDAKTQFNMSGETYRYFAIG